MYLSTFSISLPIFIGALFFRNLYPVLKILYLLILVSGGFELWAAILFFKSENNMFLYHYQTLIEFGLITLIYIMLFDKIWIKQLIGSISVVFCTVLIMNLFLDNKNELNAVLRVWEGGILTVFFIAYLYYSLNFLKVPFLELNPYFILTAGWLIYFSGTLLLFLISNSLDQSEFLPSWVIHASLNLILNILFTLVLWKGSRVLS